MHSLETIKAMNAEAAQRSREEREEPFRLEFVEDIEAMPPFPFPYLGDACGDFDDTHTRIESLFVDSSGFGLEGEPALTVREFKEKLTELLKAHGEVYAAVEEAGQFQVWVALWIPTGSTSDTEG